MCLLYKMTICCLCVNKHICQNIKKKLVLFTVYNIINDYDTEISVTS